MQQLRLSNVKKKKILAKNFKFRVYTIRENWKENKMKVPTFGNYPQNYKPAQSSKTPISANELTKEIEEICPGGKSETVDQKVKVIGLIDRFLKSKPIEGLKNYWSEKRETITNEIKQFKNN
jgi:hypothetical protein